MTPRLIGLLITLAFGFLITRSRPRRSHRRRSPGSFGGARGLLPQGLTRSSKPFVKGCACSGGWRARTSSLSTDGRGSEMIGSLPWLVEAEGADAFDRALAAMTRERAEALVILLHALFGAHCPRGRETSADDLLAGFFAEVGALMGYGPNLCGEYRRAAAYVDEILKGTKPVALPVEQPTTFALVINLKTAQARGLTILSSLLLQATEGIR
jgi:hypothetical protein